MYCTKCGTKVKENINSSTQSNKKIILENFKIDTIKLYKLLSFEAKYPVEPYEKFVISPKEHDRKLEVLGAWKTGYLIEQTEDVIYESETGRKFSFSNRWSYCALVGRESWEYISIGQAYVALSRCESLDGLYLEKPLNRKDIIVNPNVLEYLEE